MKAGKTIQGRWVAPSDVALIQVMLAENPTWGRRRLSLELCERWNWRNEKGLPKDMACRTLLLKLEKLGHVRLPPRRAPGRNNARGFIGAEMAHDTTPLDEELNELRPLRIEVPGPGEEALFKFLLHRYHYLGFRTCVGENLKLLVRDKGGRLLACLLFGSAAWKCAPRDSFIGWDASVRERRLPLLTNNTRFLILPWVRVRHLASHVLAQAGPMIPSLWMQKYGHPVHLLETFVEQERFRGTCYRAAGWKSVGVTKGRSRNDRDQTLHVPLKEIFLHPLDPDFRRRLCS